MAVSKVLSIEISDLVTRVCEMGYNKKNPTIYNSVIFKNPEYSVDDGFITDRISYGAELKTQMKNAGIKKCKDVVFILCSNKVMSREITIPEMKEDLIADLIENERGEYFPMDTSDHLFTFHVIEKLKDTKQQRVLVYAAPELLIKNYHALAAEQDMKIAAIEYNGNTIYQWLANSNSGMDMYLQINEKNSVFTILENKTFALQRNMNFGAYTLSNVLTYSGYYGKGLTDEEALLKLRDEEFVYHSFVEMEDADPEDSEQQRLHTAKESITEAIRPFISNISRVLEYYNTKNHDAQVTKIYVGGVGANIKGLKEIIESEFNGIEIVVVSQLPGLKLAKKNLVGAERSSELIGCLGITPSSINFFRLSDKAKMGKTLIFFIIAVIVTLVAAVVIVLDGKINYDKALAKQYKLQTDIATLEATGIELKEQEYYIARSKAEAIMEIADSTYNFNEDWNNILEYMETMSVSNMVISSVASSATDLTVSMTVTSKEEAAKLLLQYRAIPYFEDVQISGIVENTDEETGAKTITFSLVCTYKNPPEELKKVNPVTDGAISLDTETADSNADGEEAEE